MKYQKRFYQLGPKFIEACFFLNVLLFSQHAYTADWIEIYKGISKESDYYIDQDSITEDRFFAKVWVLKNKRSTNSSKHKSSPDETIKGNPDPQKYMSTVSMYLIDCERRNSGVVRELYFADTMGQGKLISSFKKDIDLQTLEPVKPASINADILKFVCERSMEREKIQTMRNKLFPEPAA